MAKSKIEDLIKQIEAEGYRVTKPIKRIRKTFIIEETVLNDFLETCRASNKKVQDSATEAFAQWASREKSKK